MATVRAKALDESGSVVSSQEVSPDEISSRISSVQEIFPRSVQESAVRFATGYVGPWSEWGDIIEVFEAFDGVQSVFEVDAYRGRYMCPTVHLSVSDGIESKVVQDVESYYDGFHILESGDGSILVGFDSGAYLFDRSI